MAKYDLLIVGAGLFGSVIAYEAVRMKKKVLVVEKRNHIGGNCYTEDINGVPVHMYGAHIFRTNDRSIWNYMEQFCEFNNFINSPLARYGDELYNLPFNMNTFHQLWGVRTPEEAHRMIDSTRVPNEYPSNLEEHILNIVGYDVYEKLVKHYTEKQWGKPCSELPASIMRRIPLRFTFNNNYFNDRYQGIPIGGYTPIFEKMLNGCDVRTSVDYLDDKNHLDALADLVVYTGPVDAYFDYCLGALEYRSLKFEHKRIKCENYQGNAVVNFTDADTPYTRCIEHKHFDSIESNETVVTFEYPQAWEIKMDPYYPLEDEANQKKYQEYQKMAKKKKNVRFGGRLGEYKYYDMQDTIKSALLKSNEWLR